VRFGIADPGEIVDGDDRGYARHERYVVRLMVDVEGMATLAVREGAL
jgi:hypothetical protein